MNAAPLIWLFVLTPAVGWAVAQDEESVIRKAKREISREFKYEPPEKWEAVADDDVLVLPAYTISETRFERDVERAVLKARNEFEEKQFDWKNGGTIKEFKHGGRTIEIGMWPNGAAFTLLQIKW